MSTTEELRRRLAELWNGTAPAPAKQVIELPTSVAPCRSGSCRRDDWLDQPAQHRSGWLRTACRRCGRFIGYRPIGE